MGTQIWRAYVTWGGNITLLALLSVPFLADVGTYIRMEHSDALKLTERVQGLGVALSLSCLSATVGGPIKFTTTLHVAVPFFGLSVFLNTIASSLVIYRLLAHRRQMRQFGASFLSTSQTYASLSSIFIESAALYTITGLIWFPLQILNSPVVVPVGVLFTVACFLAPALIQLRIARGVAFDHERASATLGDANKPTSVIKFKSTQDSRTEVEMSTGMTSSVRDSDVKSSSMVGVRDINNILLFLM
jgi:hypothetical protein